MGEVISKSAQLFARGTQFGDVIWNAPGERARSVADALEHTRVWDTSSGRAVAVSEMARRAESDTPGLRDALDGFLAVQGARAGARLPSRIVLAHDDTSYAATRLASLHDNGWLKTDVSALTPELVKRTLSDIDTIGGLVEAQAADAVVIGPKVSRGLTGWSDFARDGTMRTIAHELEHLVTPPDISELANASQTEVSPLNSLEEGIAQVLAQSPAHLREIERTTGIALHPRGSSSYYAAEQRAVEQLLALARIGTRTDAELGYARRVLQGGPLTEAPRRIAEQIAQYRGLQTEAVDEIETAISGSPVDYGTASRVRDIVAAHKSRQLGHS